ncbi:hypothetical protein Bhyg_07077 [Pseudolycoriella hygida]|uniref:Uncharacterized protein n=1 Tax=Pseudolycoriella hygida TaxID=35572 RepID=A0A9Q0N2W7_9DIPT|nr:hypothetical protein Bhyg_07077 [Pseudolycoriella hygida]
MERMRIVIVLSVGIIVAIIAESNGLGNGCEWSGCQEFAGAPCRTGVTGGSGRRNHIKSKSCGFLGRKDFCCDDDCGYLECGTINIANKYTNEVPRIPCGVPSTTQFWKEFVCGSNGVVPYGLSKDGNARSNNGFRSQSESSGFRNVNTDAEVRSEGFRSSGRGFRNDGVEVVVTPNVGGGGFRGT